MLAEGGPILVEEARDEGTGMEPWLTRRGAGLGDHLVEGRRLPCGQIGQHFPVQGDTGLL